MLKNKAINTLLACCTSELYSANVNHMHTPSLPTGVPMMRKIIALAVLMSSTQALARFDAKEQRSINGTAETLPQGNVELGFASFSYGITNELMLSVPTLPFVSGLFSVGAKYKLDINSKFRVSPEAHIGSYPSDSIAYASGGATLGVDLPNSRNTIDFGSHIVHMKSAPLSDVLDGDKHDDKVFTGATGRVEFNHYTQGGNLFYTGLASLSGLYVGFTWAWENVHMGIISSTASLYFPLPYIYARF
jgi:hypothetical protein